MKKKTRQLLILNGLLILIVAAAILSVNSGYARIPFSAAVRSILQPHTDGASVVVAQFRVPRIVLAVLCGMGLALAGCVMQTVTGNPLADPGILGINAGAGFAVMLFLTFFPALHIRTMAYQPIFAIAGGFAQRDCCIFLQRGTENSSQYIFCWAASVLHLYFLHLC